MPFLAETHIPIPTKDILSWSFDDAKGDPHKPIYICASRPERSINRTQALTLVRQLAAGFHAAGVREGDCVCVHAFNDVYYPILFLGILAAGGIFTGTNPAYTKNELAHHFATAQVKFVITEPEFLSNVLGASERPGVNVSRLWIFNPQDQSIPNGFSSWESLLDHGQRGWASFDNERKSKSTTAALLFSSGTTGLPKAAVLSHYNLIAQHTLVTEAHIVPYQISRLLYLPMFHAATVPMSHVGPLRSGITSYVLRRFELELFLKTIDQYHITDVTLVPPVVIAIIKYPQIRNYSLKSLKAVIAGAAPLGKENQSALQVILGPEAKVTQVWGMTEASCIATAFRYPEADETGSVGRPLPNIDSKIIDEEGRDITDYDTPGEMCLRGPTIISRYFNNLSATADSFDTEGYYKTGDVMYCSSQGRKWYVVDRRKELIKVRGFQIAPAEIEGVLLTHPGVSDAAVIGVQSSTEPDVEQPRAYIVRSPGGTLTEQDVLRHCKERLAKYKELTGGVFFLTALPRNATGKLLKRELRSTVEAKSRSRETRL